MKNIYRLVILLCLTIILVQWRSEITPEVYASPAKTNSYSECPPQSGNINVWLNAGNSPVNVPQFFNIPFDSGEKTITLGGQSYRFDNYLRGVLAAEVGGPQWNTETLQAKAALARTKVYFRCGNAVYNKPTYGYYEQDGIRGVPGQAMQAYSYNKIFTFSSSEQSRYQQAVDFGDNPYVTYNNDTFDVEYRDVSKEWTNGSSPPHQSIYDPAGLSHSGDQSKTGFIQINADHWADGVRPNNVSLPPYDLLRLLGHYLSDIGFVGFSPTPPLDYRFNVLDFGGMDDRHTNPLLLRSGRIYENIPFILQNTGNNAWSLFCSDGSYDTALSFHWYSYPAKQYISPPDPNNNIYFEGSRTALCPGSADGTSVEPGKEYPSQSQSNVTRYAYLAVRVPTGDYWLRLDVEFPQAERWGSRLQPQSSSQAYWPTQDIYVRVIQTQPGKPNPSLDPSHQAGQWSNQAGVTISWSAIDDPMGVNYQYRWDGGDWQTTSGASASRTLSNGVHKFEALTIAKDGITSDLSRVNDIRIDATLPIAQLAQLPPRIQASDYILNWDSSDSGGSDLVQQELTYQINNDGVWRPVSAVGNDVNMRSIRFYFPEGRHGDVYQFCLRNRDGAGNWSDSSCGSTIFAPDPELHVSPPQLTWFSVYSNTQPRVESLTIENYGGHILNWTATTPFTLATLGQTNGTAPPITTIPVTLTHPVGITATYQGYITVDSPTPGVYNAHQVIPVTIYVLDRDNTQYLPVIFKQ